MSGDVIPESASWRTTAVVMLTVSVTVFLVQRFIVMFLEPIFEVCIFHLPALVATSIYLKKQEETRLARSAHKG